MTDDFRSCLSALLLAVDQVLDDMQDGLCCCPAAKAMLVEAFEPFVERNEADE